MGVGLYVTGRYPAIDGDQSPEDWLETAAAWLEGHEEEPLMLCRQGQNQDDTPTLFVQVHPSAEDVELSVIDPGQLAVTAKTSSLGPGYHIFLCRLLHSLGQHFDVAWDEPQAYCTRCRRAFFPSVPQPRPGRR